MACERLKPTYNSVAFGMFNKHSSFGSKKGIQILWCVCICVFYFLGGWGAGREERHGVLFQNVIAFLIDSVIRTLQNIYNLNVDQNSCKSGARICGFVAAFCLQTHTDRHFVQNSLNT